MIFRVVAALLFIGVAVCVGAALITEDRRYLRWALLLVKLAIALGLAFFGVLLLERAVIAL